jgi:hypothetical protein
MSEKALLLPLAIASASEMEPVANPPRSTVLARRRVHGQTPRSTSAVRPGKRVRSTERSERSHWVRADRPRR